MSQLIDPFQRHIKYLRVSVIDKCDFRCFYCIPKGFKDFTKQDKRLSLDEHVRLIRLFSELGVTRVRLTGGEPLVRNDIAEMTRKIRALPAIEDLSLSTNASRLALFAEDLQASGIDRVNVSLDSLNAKTFKEITQGDLSQVLEGLEAARKFGLAPIKINMVVMRGVNLHEIESMVEYCQANQFTLRLIETMPIGEGGQRAQSEYVSLDEVRTRLEQVYNFESANMYGAGPARYVKVKGTDLKIGFISPMSQHFCADCNRVRLSSEGTLYLCLGQNDKLEMRLLLRSGYTDDELKLSILEAISRKPEKHEFNSKKSQIVRIMSKTGG